MAGKEQSPHADLKIVASWEERTPRDWAIHRGEECCSPTTGGGGAIAESRARSIRKGKNNRQRRGRRWKLVQW